jgi:hypothetical protein
MSDLRITTEPEAAAASYYAIPRVDGLNTVIARNFQIYIPRRVTGLRKSKFCCLLEDVVALSFSSSD